MFEDVLILKKGGIHIKKKNIGSFTRYCGGNVTQECIERGKNSPSAAIRKKSVFADNARRWKHENGGILKVQEVQRILDEVRKANLQHAYTIDLLNMKKPKRVWEAMTGQYEDGGKLTDDDYRERIKKFLLWRTVGPEESTYIKNFKM